MNKPHSTQRTPSFMRRALSSVHEAPDFFFSSFFFFSVCSVFSVVKTYFRLRPTAALWSRHEVLAQFSLRSSARLCGLCVSLSLLHPVSHASREISFKRKDAQRAAESGHTLACSQRISFLTSQLLTPCYLWLKCLLSHLEEGHPLPVLHSSHERNVAGSSRSPCRSCRLQFGRGVFAFLIGDGARPFFSSGRFGFG